MTSTQPPPARRSGRARSERARAAILRAARDELTDKGFRRLTVDSIASRAGVGKATIYRWWANKAAVMFDAVNSTEDRYPDFAGGADVRLEVLEELRNVIKYFGSDAGGAFLDLVAESRFDGVLANALSAQFVAARRQAARDVITRGVDAGQAPDPLDVEIFMDMVWGAIYYRLLVLHDQPDPEYAERLLEQAWPQSGG